MLTEYMPTELLRRCIFRDYQSTWIVALVQKWNERTLRLVIRERLNRGEPFRTVYSENGFRSSPLHAEDSMQSMLSFVALACHSVTHSEETGARIPCEWDADGLAECASIREHELERKAGR